MRALFIFLGLLAAAIGGYMTLRSVTDGEAAEPQVTAPSTTAAATEAATPEPPDYKTQLESYTGHGEWVTYTTADGAEISGYIAFPERPDAAPGMIVIHEIFGMSDFVRAVAHDLAEAGYVAIAPDFLSRAGGTQGADDARAAIRDLDPEGLTADLDGAKAYLRSLASVQGDRIGVIGFCWGGRQTFDYATRAADIGAAVVCYGSAPSPDAMAAIEAPVLGVYAENDARINNALPDVEAAMRAAGKSFTHEIYPGANHGFIRSRNVPDEADRAWANILEFLSENLGGSD